MISVEAPVRTLESQRQVLLELGARVPWLEERVQGAVEVLDWLLAGAPGDQMVGAEWL